MRGAFGEAEISCGYTACRWTDRKQDQVRQQESLSLEADTTRRHFVANALGCGEP